MWVDQKDLKLYITGADMPRIHAAARLVGDLISKAPVNVNSAGVEDEVSALSISYVPQCCLHFYNGSVRVRAHVLSVVCTL